MYLHKTPLEIINEHREERMSLTGFTFIELIFVVVILSILVSIGTVLYTNTVEHSRTAEAKANLGTIRTMAAVYFQDNNDVYPDDTYLSGTLGLPIGTNYACSNSNYFFQYHIDNAGTATAYRCTSGGRERQGSTAYSLSLTIDGAGSSSPTPDWW